MKWEYYFVEIFCLELEVFLGMGGCVSLPGGQAETITGTLVTGGLALSAVVGDPYQLKRHYRNCDGFNDRNPRRKSVPEDDFKNDPCQRNVETNEFDIAADAAESGAGDGGEDCDISDEPVHSNHVINKLHADSDPKKSSNDASEGSLKVASSKKVAPLRSPLLYTVK